MIMQNFPFTPGQFYNHDEIRQKLKLGMTGGIRPSNENNIVVLFWNAPHIRRNDGGIANDNIYLDRYDKQTGLIHYTGEGQEGDQTLGGNNGRIVSAKQNGDTIHFFRQYRSGHPRQYLGEVEFVEYSIERQPDRNGNDRNVYLFILKLLTDTSVISRGLDQFIEENEDTQEES